MLPPTLDIATRRLVERSWRVVPVEYDGGKLRLNQHDRFEFPWTSISFHPRVDQAIGAGVLTLSVHSGTRVAGHNSPRSHGE